MQAFDSQPIRGIPVLKYGDMYYPVRSPVEVGKISDNESYADFEGHDDEGIYHKARLTVTTEGSGDVRTNIRVKLEEIT